MKRLFMILFVLSVAGTALAQGNKCPTVPANEAAAQKRAGRYFSEAQSMVERGRRAEAVERFLCSLKMTPHPNTVFNIQTLAEEVEDKDTILPTMRAFRDENPGNSATPEIADMIAKLEHNLPLDGPTPDEIAKQEAEAQRAEQERLAALAAAQEQSMSDDMNVLQREREARQAQEEKARKYKVAGITLLGVSAAPLALGVTFTIMAKSAQNDAQDATSWDDFQYYDERSMRFASGASVGYLLTAGLLVPGVVLLVKSKKIRQQKDAPPAHHFDMSFNVAPNGFVVGGTF